MNAPVLLAQLSPKNLKIEKPQNGQALTFHLDGNTRLDFSDVASEKLTFVRVGNKLIVLFDNQSTVTVDPVFDSAGHPLPDVAFEMAPDRTLSGDEFAALFPITTDQSVLPAAGGSGPTAGAHFGDPTVDPLSTFTPLDLLGALPGPNINFGAHTDVPSPLVPNAAPDTATVVEAGIHPTNVPFSGTPVATGNVLTNDLVAEVGVVKTVTDVGAGSGSIPSGHVGAAVTGTYGTLVLNADGTYTYTLDPANPAGIALAQNQHASDPFTYTMNDGLGHTFTTTLTIDVIGTDQSPVIAPVDKVEFASSPIVENALVTGDPTLHVETGTIHFTDVDLTDRPTATVTTQAVTYTSSFGDEGHTTLTLTPAQLAAIEQAFTVANTPGSTNNGAIDWTYSIADNALDFLAPHETITLVSTVLLDDHNGGTDTATVTLTIEGSNDLPIITQVDNGEVTKDFMPAGTASEIANGDFETGDLTGWSAGPNVFVDNNNVLDGQFSARLNATGGTQSLFQDVATHPGQNYVVQFTLAAAPDDVTNDFTVTWDGSKVLLTLVDSPASGAKTYQFVVIGDPVNATSRLEFDFQDDGTGWLLDDVSVKPIPNPQAASGNIGFNDADFNDFHSASSAFVSTDLDGGLGPQLGSLIANVTHNTAAGVGGIAHWDFAVNNSDPNFQALGAEDTVHEVFAVTISDIYGGHTTQDVTITLHGVNDAPVFDHSATIGGTFFEIQDVTGSNAPVTASGSLGFTDINLHDVGYTATILGETSSGLAVGLPPDLATLESFLTLGPVSKNSGSSTGSVPTRS